MRLTSDDAATASNWKSVLMGDAAIGVIALVAGWWLASSGRTIVGSLLVGAGLGYIALVVSRYRRWRTLRRDAGLDA